MVHGVINERCSIFNTNTSYMPKNQMGAGLKVIQICIKNSYKNEQIFRRDSLLYKKNTMHGQPMRC